MEKEPDSPSIIVSGEIEYDIVSKNEAGELALFRGYIDKPETDNELNPETGTDYELEFGIPEMVGFIESGIWRGWDNLTQMERDTFEGEVEYCHRMKESTKINYNYYMNLVCRKCNALIDSIKDSKRNSHPLEKYCPKCKSEYMYLCYGNAFLYLKNWEYNKGVTLTGDRPSADSPCLSYSETLAVLKNYKDYFNTLIDINATYNNYGDIYIKHAWKSRKLKRQGKPWSKLTRDIFKASQKRSTSHN